MRMKLAWIKIRNFKGINSFECELGERTNITAENGRGKTSLYDAFLWLFTGKDSEGKTDFEIVPLNLSGRKVESVTVEVEAGVSFDGIEHVLKKVQEEKRSKNGEVRGYEKACWVDEVPYLLNKYTEWIAERIDGERFKLLTNLRYFCDSKEKGGMHHTDRRRILMELSGGSTLKPDGFGELMEAKGDNVDLDGFKTILRERKKGYKCELDGVSPRIDELLRGMVHPDCDIEGLERARGRVAGEIAVIHQKYSQAREKENARAGMIAQINDLTRSMGNRERELLADTSNTDALRKERNEIKQKHMDHFDLVAKLSGELRAAERAVTEKKALHTSLMERLDSARERVTTYKSAKLDETCEFCGAKFTAKRIALAKRSAKLFIKECEDDAAKIMKEVSNASDSLKEAVEVATKTAAELEKERKIDVKMAADLVKKLKEINKQIDSSPTPPPEKDRKWLEICTQIAKLEKEKGEPVTEQLKKLDAEKDGLESELRNINAVLAESDRIEKDKARIGELKDRAKELGQKLAETEKFLKQIELYRQAESNLITKAVNDKFKIARFKMFDENIGDDGIRECCEVTYHGTPFQGLSSGEQVFVECDVVNTLSVFYDANLPRFIDHAESVTLPLETDSQTIKLFAVKGVEELKVEIE